MSANTTIGLNLQDYKGGQATNQIQLYNIRFSDVSIIVITIVTLDVITVVTMVIIVVVAYGYTVVLIIIIVFIATVSVVINTTSYTNNE